VNSAADADNASPAAATAQRDVMLAARVSVEAASAEAPSSPSRSSRRDYTGVERLLARVT
jgi:hypothetical protein